jgi:ABC-type polysaccharide/polyol phosphate transport system ATPase subunit
MKISENIIEVEEISRIYKSKNSEVFIALNNISFALKKGDSIGLIGANGSGKSTLLKILSGYLKPTSGLIKIKGEFIGILDIGSGFHPDLTGEENLKFILKQNQLDDKNSVLKDIIEFAELQKFIKKPIKTFSSGMFMKLALSTYLKLNYSILFIDEVFSTGDIAFQKKVFDFIKKNKEQITLVLASHDLNMINQITEKCIWLKNGEIFQIGDSNDVTSNYLRFLNKKCLKNLNQVVFENEILTIFSSEIKDKFVENKIEFNSPYSIVIKLRLKKNIGITFGLRISDFSNNNIHFDSPYFNTSNFLIDKKGDYALEINYPPLLLAYGFYKSNLVVWFDQKQSFEIDLNLLFEITKGNFYNSNINFENKPAISLLPLSWNVSNLIQLI